MYADRNGRLSEFSQRRVQSHLLPVKLNAELLLCRIRDLFRRNGPEGLSAGTDFDRDRDRFLFEIRSESLCLFQLFSSDSRLAFLLLLNILDVLRGRLRGPLLRK